MPKSSSPGSSTTEARRYKRSDIVVGQAAEEFGTLGAGGRAALERRAFGAVADDLQRHPRQSRRRRWRVDALVGDERRHDQRKSLGRRAVRAKNVRVDRGIHDCRLAIIVSADPARNIMRDSHIAVRTAGRVAVPAGHPRHDRPHDAAAQPRRSARARSRRRTGPRRSASASGSSRDAAHPAP